MQNQLTSQIFIFNWKNQEQKVLQKIQQLNDAGYNPIIINSDDTLRDKYDWVHIGEQAYFTEQFNTAVNLFNSDLFIHIQGDASYDNWGQLISDAQKYFTIYNYGIYAPDIDYTNWYAESVNINQLSDNIWEILNTDSICWFIHKDIINEYEPIDVSQNKFGWGIDWYLIHISNAKNRKVIRDYNHKVLHPNSTNYDKEQATKELQLIEQKIKNLKFNENI